MASTGIWWWQRYRADTGLTQPIPPPPPPQPAPPPLGVLGYAVAAIPPSGRPALTHTSVLTLGEAGHEARLWRQRAAEGWRYEICAIRGGGDHP